MNFGKFWNIWIKQNELENKENIVHCFKYSIVYANTFWVSNMTFKIQWNRINHFMFYDARNFRIFNQNICLDGLTQIVQNATDYFLCHDIFFFCISKKELWKVGKKRVYLFGLTLWVLVKIGVEASHKVHKL